MQALKEKPDKFDYTTIKNFSVSTELAPLKKVERQIKPRDNVCST